MHLDPVSISHVEQDLPTENQHPELPKVTSFPRATTLLNKVVSPKPTEQLGALSKQITENKAKASLWATAAKTAKTVGLLLGVLVGAVVGGGLALISSPLIALGYVIYRIVPTKFKTEKQKLTKSIETMKKTEELDKLNTMKGALISLISSKKVNQDSPAEQIAEHSIAYLTDGLKICLEGPKKDKIIQNKQASQILRRLKSFGLLTPQWINAIKKPEVQDFFSESFRNQSPDVVADALADIIKNNDVFITQEQLKNILEAPFEDINIPTEANIKEFKNKFDNLYDIFKDDANKNPTKANREFIQNLRELIKDPVYQYLKEDSSQPAIHLIHRCVSDIWNKAPALSAYIEVGAEIIGMTLKPKEEHGKTLTAEKQAEKSKSGKDIAELIEKSHKKVTSIYSTDHGIPAKAVYAATHLRQALGSMNSEGEGSFAQFLSRGKYDSHGTLSNNPSLQGTTSLKWGEGDATINNCYGGSPTIGDDEIAPEFEALLQAAENEQLKDPKNRDSTIPMVVNYNNLQDLNKKTGENARSSAIMKLNEKYPLSFRGTTFSKDSALYMMNKQKDVVWESPKQFGPEMKKQLEKCFDDPKNVEHGFYFHGKKEDWSPIFNEVIDSAVKHFSSRSLAKERNKIRQLEGQILECLGKQPPDNEGAALKKAELIKEKKVFQGAFQEYVYSMLNAVLEMESIKSLAEQGIKDPKIMAISACKENIDRGGMENTKYMYLRLSKGERHRATKITTVAHLRAIAVRDRAILEKRMPQVLNFLKTTDPDDFNTSLGTLIEKLGYKASQMRFESANTSEMQEEHEDIIKKPAQPPTPRDQILSQISETPLITITDTPLPKTPEVIKLEQTSKKISSLSSQSGLVPSDE